MKENLRCTLCDYVIYPEHIAREYAEGPFCADVAGCRRRALHRMRGMYESLDLLKRWAEGDKTISYQDALDTMKNAGIKVTA